MTIENRQQTLSMIVEFIHRVNVMKCVQYALNDKWFFGKRLVELLMLVSSCSGAVTELTLIKISKIINTLFWLGLCSQSIIDVTSYTLIEIGPSNVHYGTP